VELLFFPGIAMSVLEFAIGYFVGMALYLLVLPGVGCVLLEKGLKRVGAEQPFKLCARVSFASTYAAFFSLVLLGQFLLPDLTQMKGRLAWTGAMLAMQLILVVVLMRDYKPKSLAVEVAVFVVLNALVFGINLLLMPARPISVG
jgi:hypothetical protein